MGSCVRLRPVRPNQVWSYEREGAAPNGRQNAVLGRVRERSCDLATGRRANHLSAWERPRRPGHRRPQGDCPSLGAAAAHQPRGRKPDECGGAGVDPTAPTCLHLGPVAVRARWMSGSMRCTWASIGCGSGSIFVAGPGWRTQRMCGVGMSVAESNRWPSARHSQAMTAGELPPSKAQKKRPRWRPQRSYAGRPRMEMASGSPGDGRALRKDGPDRPACVQTSTRFRIREYAVAGVGQIASYSLRG